MWSHVENAMLQWSNSLFSYCQQLTAIVSITKTYSKVGQESPTELLNTQANVPAWLKPLPAQRLLQLDTQCGAMMQEGWARLSYCVHHTFGLGRCGQCECGLEAVVHLCSEDGCVLRQ